MDTNQYDSLSTLFGAFSNWYVALIVCLFAFCGLCAFLYFRYKTKPTDPMLKFIDHIEKLFIPLQGKVNKLAIDFDRNINKRKEPLQTTIDNMSRTIKSIDNRLRAVETNLNKAEINITTAKK